MRILHTADWHAGKGLQGRGRIEECDAVLEEIVAVARREEVDGIIVAGDLFDAASPPPEAERVVYRALLDLGEIAPVLVVPGNHDNERRLAAVAPAFARANVTIRAFVAEEPVELTAKSGETARIVLLPWLSQRYILRADKLMGLDADDLSQEYAARATRIISHLARAFSTGTVNLFAGHLTVAGSRLGGGERVAQTIFHYWVDASVFPSDAHAVALGHIHKMQRIPAPCPLYYCGSPMQLDFSDADDSKHVLIIEASPSSPAEVTPVALTTGRKLRTITGSLADLSRMTGETGDDFLRVVVKEKARAGLGDEVRALFPEAVKVVVDSDDADQPPAPVERRRGASPGELFTAYLESRGVEDRRLVDMFERLYEECVT
jgi:exonuclease SbcD